MLFSFAILFLLQHIFVLAVTCCPVLLYSFETVTEFAREKETLGLDLSILNKHHFEDFYYIPLCICKYLYINVQMKAQTFEGRDCLGQ